MTKRKFSGNFFEFPLCCLIYVGEKKERLNDIAEYFIFVQAYKIDKTIDLNERLKIVEDSLNYSLCNKDFAFNNYRLIEKLINQHIKANGYEPYCRVGKELFLETIKGKFEYRLFALLCAITAVLGKTKAYKRISKERLRYAMIGYKSKEVFTKEKKGNLDPLSDRVIGNLVDKLELKKLIMKFTYQRRHTYYSTRIKTKKILAEYVNEFKSLKQSQKLKMEDALLSKMITDNLLEQRSIHRERCNVRRKVVSV